MSESMNTGPRYPVSGSGSTGPTANRPVAVGGPSGRFARPRGVP